MTQQKPPTDTAPIEAHDPYKMRTLEQILSLFDGGDFLRETMDEHQELQLALLEHKDLHGTKGCQGTLTIQISYALGKSGDVQMGATRAVKQPKKPPSSAAAFINDDGELTLYSPFLRQMQRPVRDVTPHDPVTGEIRDID
ncbi:hypothetical protein [Shimia thalassica]|uniref:hypothetical protein n=1 Tax=Shimia thalassica TaxID=1715693 RepID=UPI0026E48C14|nr:hypothetical protein [Shimia thalassica]MDO6799395.1 hypothetical protein [Shimia thalassica]